MTAQGRNVCPNLDIDIREANTYRTNRPFAQQGSWDVERAGVS